MPEISDEEFTELNRLRSQSVAQETAINIANFRAENPHVPAKLLEAYSGDPAGVAAYGTALLESFPKPAAPPPPATPDPAAPPAATAPPATPQPPTPPAPPAGPPAFTPPPAPIPGVSPIMAAQFPVQQTAEAQRQAYLQQVGTGTVLTPEQAAAAAVAAAPASSAPTPQPGVGNALTPSNAVSAQSEQIRERMKSGVATVPEVQWLAQFGEKGFRESMTSHARQVRAAVGR